LGQLLVFLDWFPKLASIGVRCREPILYTIGCRGFMATGEAEVIDNPIIGFTQARRPLGLASKAHDHRFRAIARAYRQE